MQRLLSPLIRFSGYALSVCFLLLFTGCFKEKSLELPTGGVTLPPPGTGNSTATFALIPSGSDCSGAIVSGTYTVGAAVTATNMVALMVKVTKAGSWSYSTGTVQGFGFSGSGNFATTGQEIIVLMASGKPATAGTVLFPLTIGAAASCNFAVTVNSAGGGPNPTSDPYYKATIGGVNYIETVTATNNFEAGSGISGSDDVWFSAGIYSRANPVPAGVTGMDIEKAVMHGYDVASDAQFKAFFPVGTHPYAPPGMAKFLNGDGVIVGWTDKNGEDWTSHHETLAQPSSSSFKIISVVDERDLLGTLYIKVKMEFNCTLYKVSDPTKTLQLTNGEMVGYFGKI
jgi:hypothetical protein